VISISSVTGGTAPYSYDFNGLGYDTASSFNGLAAGFYTLSVRDANNCTHDTILGLNNQGGPTDLQLSLFDDTCGLNKGSIVIDSVVAGTTPYTYGING